MFCACERAEKHRKLVLSLKERVATAFLCDALTLDKKGGKNNHFCTFSGSQKHGDEMRDYYSLTGLPPMSSTAASSVQGSTLVAPFMFRFSRKSQLEHEKPVENVPKGESCPPPMKKI